MNQRIVRNFQPTHCWEGDRNLELGDRVQAVEQAFQPTHCWEGDRNPQH